MNAIICSDLCIESDCNEELDVRQIEEWKKTRKEKLRDLIETAVQSHSEYLFICGKSFGNSRVTESSVDSILGIIGKYDLLKVIMIIDSQEYKFFSYKKSLPDNVTLISSNKEDYNDDKISVSLQNAVVNICVSDHYSAVLKEENGEWIIKDNSETYSVPGFEPLGFDDSESRIFGYALLNFSENKISDFRITGNAVFSYSSLQISVNPTEKEEELINKLNRETLKFERKTFLRFTIRGRCGFALMFSSDAVKKKLQSRLFYVEVFDNTVMDIDENDFINDISLKSEFIRLALNDDGLSESERNRIICSGWNALNSGR